MNCAETAATAWRSGRRGDPLADWRCLLPPEWQAQVVAALDFASFRDYEMPAGRCFGYDEDGAGCYYAHDYAIAEARSDDDESYYTAIAYGETLRAWRLRDGRWLTYRRDYGEACSPQRGFFALTETPPRIPAR